MAQPLVRMSPAMPSPAQSLFVHPAPAIAETDQPPTKKSKSVRVRLLGEDEFLKQADSKTVLVRVMIPTDPEGEYTGWLFKGQTLDLSMQLTDTLTDVKNRISEQLGGMPDKKMKINFLGGSFLNRDDASLAYYNIGSGSILQLGVKERGGGRRTVKP